MSKNNDRQRTTTDALEIIYHRFYKGRPDRIASLEEERANAEVARKIYDLRQDAGLTQRELAKLVGTTASVICRLEDADYEGHSLAMLNRVAAALGMKPRISFVRISAVEHSFSPKSRSTTSATSRATKKKVTSKTIGRKVKSAAKVK